jgi:hypothetical protein
MKPASECLLFLHIVACKKIIIYTSASCPSSMSSRNPVLFCKTIQLAICASIRMVQANQLCVEYYTPCRSNRRFCDRSLHQTCSLGLRSAHQLQVLHVYFSCNSSRFELEPFAPKCRISDVTHFTMFLPMGSVVDLSIHIFARLRRHFFPQPVCSWLIPAPKKMKALHFLKKQRHRSIPSNEFVTVPCHRMVEFTFRQQIPGKILVQYQNMSAHHRK